MGQRRHEEELMKASSSIIPIVIVVDRSKSMSVCTEKGDYTSKNKMELLNDGLNKLIDQLNDADIADSASIAIVGFDAEANVIQNFTTAENIKNINITYTNNSGNTYEGVKKGLEILDEEVILIDEQNLKRKQPWIIIMSDGVATIPYYNYNREGQRQMENNLKIIQREIRERESKQKITSIPCLIYSDVNMNDAEKQMRGFRNDGKFAKVSSDESDLSFIEFFEILSKSISTNMNFFNKEENSTNFTNVDFVDNNEVYENPNDNNQMEDQFNIVNNDTDLNTLTSEDINDSQNDDFNQIETTNQETPLVSNYQETPLIKKETPLQSFNDNKIYVNNEFQSNDNDVNDIIKEDASTDNDYGFDEDETTYDIHEVTEVESFDDIEDNKNDSNLDDFVSKLDWDEF